MLAHIEFSIYLNSTLNGSTYREAGLINSDGVKSFRLPLDASLHAIHRGIASLYDTPVEVTQFVVALINHRATG
jgi:hypothetical protein